MAKFSDPLTTLLSLSAKRLSQDTHSRILRETLELSEVWKDGLS
jgi:hypothetical protein